MHWLKRITPTPIYRHWRAWQHQRDLDAAVRAFGRLPATSVPSDSELQELVRLWGNAEWSALPEYMQAFIAAGRSSSGPVLECGSGLSTVLLGLILDQRGGSLWTLEHHPDWYLRMQRVLLRYGIRSVHLLHAPLVNHGPFDWYSPPVAELPRDFSLVICDGPPAVTRGGRYGMLPVMRQHLAPGCTVLLDDAARPDEQSALAQWAAEAGLSWEMAGTAGPYAVARLPG
jgi:hypothetical protein